jgi:hypothetical protein
MAKRRKPPVPPGGQGRDRSKDRHESTFMIRLPDEYRLALQKYQDLIASRHRFRPTMTDVIKNALEDLLAKEALWPASKDETEEG